VDETTPSEYWGGRGAKVAKTTPNTFTRAIQAKVLYRIGVGEEIAFRNSQIQVSLERWRMISIQQYCFGVTLRKTFTLVKFELKSFAVAQLQAQILAFTECVIWEIPIIIP
jgi:hypothetical protein